MKKIIKWKSIDGKEFYSKVECSEYEVLINLVKKVIEPLGSKPEITGCGFENGKGYLQHTREKIEKVTRDLLRLIENEIDHELIKQTIENPIEKHISWAASLVSGYSKFDPVSKGLYRLQCVDEYFREWGQPYFALNPEKGEQVKLN